MSHLSPLAPLSIIGMLTVPADEEPSNPPPGDPQRSAAGKSKGRSHRNAGKPEDGVPPADRRAGAIMFAILLILLLASVAGYLSLHVRYPVGTLPSAQFAARDAALAAVLKAQMALEQVAPVAAATATPQAGAEATQSPATGPAVLSPEAIAVLEAQRAALEKSVQDIPWAKDALTSTLSAIAKELKSPQPSPAALLVLFEAAHRTIGGSGYPYAWSVGASRWLELAFWAWIGALLYLLSNIASYWRVGRYLEFLPWYLATLVRAPIVALLLLAFITSVDAQVFGIQIAVSEAPIELLIFLAAVLGYFGNVAFEQLKMLVEKIFPTAAARSLPYRRLSISPASARLAPGETKEFKALPDRDVVWNWEPHDLGALSQSGEYTAPATLDPTRRTVFIQAVSARDSSEWEVAVVTLAPAPALKLTADPQVLTAGKASVLTALPHEKVKWELNPADRGKIEATAEASGKYTFTPVDPFTPGVVVIRAVAEADPSRAAEIHIKLAE
jgi:hypothetical protein